jgi:hypothetical protein
VVQVGELLDLALGFTLLVLVYWLGGELFLIDRTVLDIAVWQGALISAASLALGWVVYDQLCKSRFGDEPVRLMVALFGIIVLMSLFYTSVFSGRAALLHLGAFHGDDHVGERVLHDHPQPEGRGRGPDRGAKARSQVRQDRQAAQHAQQLPDAARDLPDAVEPLPPGLRGENTWIIASLVFLMGVTIRHWFNTSTPARGTRIGPGRPLP